MTSSYITLRSEHSGRHLAIFWNKISWVKIMVILFTVCSEAPIWEYLSRFQHLGHWRQIHYLNQWWQKMHCAKSGGKVRDCSLEENRQNTFHDDVIKWKHLPRYWPFVRGIHRSPVNSPHKGQWRGALMFTLICTRINDWVNNREAGDLRHHRGHYDVTVMLLRRDLSSHIAEGWYDVKFTEQNLMTLLILGLFTLWTTSWKFIICKNNDSPMVAPFSSGMS